MKKISIIGAGRVGESLAQLLAKSGLCREVALLSVRDYFAEGVALDIMESAPILGFDTKVVGGSDPIVIADSDVVVVTRGLARKPGMDRTDLLNINKGLVDTAIDDIQRFSPHAKLIMVANPVDLLTYYAWKRTGWERSRIFGLSGVLDAARMATFIALETGFSVKDISTLVMGAHGNSLVPLPRYANINGVPITHFLSQQRIDGIVERTMFAGTEILGLKKSGSANEAPAAAILSMIDAMAHDRQRILPCVAILDGEYDQKDIAIGVPVVVGIAGAQQIIELELNSKELSAFQLSVENIRKEQQKIAPTKLG